MKKITLALIVLLTGSTTFLFSQTKQNVTSTVPPHRTCATDEIYEAQILNNPTVKQMYEQARQQMLQERDNINNGAKGGPKTAGVLVTIPVVVHVLYHSGTPTITTAQVNSQINRLNTDYRKLNSDISGVRSTFMGDTTDMRVEFCLAQTDPNGNATTGIIFKYTSTTTFVGTTTSEPMKYSSQNGDDVWDRTKYLNLWVCKFTYNGSSGILGYAQFPGGPAATDGVVIHQDYFGDGGTAQSPYNKGRTATHEIGHWLGLYHPFQGGCTGMSSSNCSSQGDLCCDTPPVSSPNYGCSIGNVNSCAETYSGNRVDMWENYMDYADDACMIMFSHNQKTIVQATLNGSRASLKTSTVCAAPGSLPTAAFNQSVTTVCVGDTVVFTDASTGAAATSYSWNFGTGATPATASTAGPHSVVYSTPGSKTISLTTANGTGQTSASHTVSVVANPTPTISGAASTCASSNGTYTVTGFGGSTFTFSAVGGTIGTTTANSAVVNWGSGSTGQVICMEQSSNGCMGYDTIHVTLTSGFTTSISGSSSACTGIGQQFTIPSISGSTYSWSATGGSVTSGGSTNTATITYTTAGTQKVIVTQTIGVGCSAVDTNIITVYQTPSPNITGSTNVCVGDVNTYTVAAISGSIYNWVVSGGTINTGIGTNSIGASWTTGGIKTINITHTNNGCPGSTAATIAVHTLPVPTFTSSNNNGTVTFTNTTSGGSNNTYTWYFGDGTNTSGINVSHTYTSPAVYNVCLSVTDQYNCSDSACKMVDVVFTGVNNVNALSQLSIYPNPTNDVLHIDYSLRQVSDLQITIVDVLGKIVLSQNCKDCAASTHQTTINTTSLPQGVYFVKLSSSSSSTVRKFVKN